MSTTQDSILVFRSAALGDFILACPALVLLRKIYPTSKIVLVTLQSVSKAQREKVAAYAGATSKMPWVELARPHLIDEVEVLDDVFSIRGLSQGRVNLAKYKFSKVILLLDPAAPWPGRLKKIFLMWFLVGIVPVFGWRGKGSLNGNKARQHSNGALKHHVYGPLQFLTELPLVPLSISSSPTIKFDLRPNINDVKWAADWIQQHSESKSIYIGMAPGSIQPHKRWPLEKFADLCALLLDIDLRVSIVVLGTPGDIPLGNELVNIAPSRISNLAGNTTIGQSAALLTHFQLLVGNDGGAIHLGDAMGIKVVSIIPGIEYSDSIEPWNNKNLAIRHPIDCAPCYNFTECPLGHNKCMLDLPLSAVFESCRVALSSV